MFRYLNQIEKEIIKNLLSIISPNFISDFEELLQNLYISTKRQTLHNNFPEIYLLSEELKDLLKNSIYIDNISLAGLYFGFIKKGEFYLSIEGAEFLYKRGFTSDNIQIKVNKSGEKSILYGNNILKNMLVERSYNFKEKQVLLVFNEEDELIAIANSILKGSEVQNLKSKDCIAINLRDKGIYLREKQ